MSKDQHSILILCDAFGPPAYVPRVRNLTINLQKIGWQVQVISELMPHCAYQTTDFPLALMRYYSTCKWKHHIQWLADQLWFHKEHTFTKFVEQQTDVAQYDIILCSSFNVFPLQTAHTLAQKYHKPLLVDLRDIAEQWGQTRYLAHKIPHLCGLENWLISLYEKRNIRLRNKVIKAAQAITTISPWHAKWLQTIVPNVQLIYNGFNSEEFYRKDIPEDKFIISYTGRIYDFELRNPHLLFEAVERLLLSKQIAKEDIALQFYIDHASIAPLQQLAQQYHSADVVEVQGYVPNSQILSILHHSSIVLILANKTTAQGPFGIMTTKFFEALGVEKPVLCVRSDEDCLAAAIQQTNAGLAATTADEAATFLLEKYNEWKTQGYTHQDVRQKELFTRQSQALQFDKLLRSIIE